jgi:hypothetical protein
MKKLIFPGNIAPLVLFVNAGQHDEGVSGPIYVAAGCPATALCQFTVGTVQGSPSLCIALDRSHNLHVFFSTLPSLCHLCVWCDSRGTAPPGCWA